MRQALLGLTIVLATAWANASGAQEAGPAEMKEAAPEAVPVQARDPLCVPGQQIQCACPSGALGYQVCADDGMRVDACQCEEAAVPPSPDGPAAQPQPELAKPPSYHVEPAPREPERRSRGAMIAGIVLLSVGGVGAIFAGVALHIERGEQDRCQSEGNSCINREGHDQAVVANTVGVVVGSALAVTGIILIAVGAPRKSAEDAEAALVVGPGFTGVRGSF
jgi:hypothetical protein